MKSRLSQRFNTNLVLSGAMLLFLYRISSLCYYQEVTYAPIIGVETPIPAFIECTQNAVDRLGKNLTGKPTINYSFSEFISLFGGEDVFLLRKVNLDDENKLISVETTHFVLVHSLAIYVPGCSNNT